MSPTSTLFRIFKKQRPNALLSSVSALGLGLGFLGNSVAKADDLQTIIPPQFYQQTDDGHVVLTTTDGKPIILNKGQYLILEDGLLIITDELAQNALNSLSVLGSFRSSDFNFPGPVYSSSGDIIETASHEPLWSGDRPTFRSLGIETYELAQQTEEQSESEAVSNSSGLGNAGLGAGFGFGLMGLISGFFGNGSPEEISSQPTPQETPQETPGVGAKGFVINGIEAGDASGWSISSAGDINKDGYDDIVIGAPNAGSDAGESYVVFGKASGTYAASLELSALDGTNGFVINGIDTGDNSGIAVSSAGDINGDTFDDIIIGAPFAGTSTGESYVVFGKAAGYSASLELSSILSGDGTNGFVINGIDADDYSGNYVSSAGDINNDGYDEIIIGAPAADPNGDGSGEAYVVFGKATGYSASLELSSILSGDGTSGFVINGIDAGDGAACVSSAGDINNDGYDDIIIGALGADPNGDISGESYVVFGKATGYSASLELSSILSGDGTSGFVINGIDAGDLSGTTVSSAGDINGDTFDDMIIGAISISTEFRGEYYVVFGKASGTYAASLELSALDGTDGFAINGLDPNDRAPGPFVSSAGDINYDGYDDIIIGAAFADPNGDSSGESYVVFGQSEFDAFVELDELALMV